ncbi:MAG: phosphotransferase [Nanoarchaeota archaeon]
MADPSVSVIRMILGDDYIRFEKDVILRSLEQLAEQGKLPRKTLAKIKLGLEHGESIPITEEALDYQSRNGRDGGAFLRVSIDLPDGVKLQNFVKVHSDEKTFKNESSITRVLHESGSRYTLPLFYVDEERNLMSTPFIPADSALSYFTSNPQSREKLLTDCVEALFDTYTRARSHSKEIQPLIKGGKDAISRIKDIALPWLTGTKEATGLEGLITALKENYSKCHDDATHVLIHGDPQLCNFLKSDEQVYLIDWEMARMGSLHQDIYRLLLRTGDNSLRNSVLKRAFSSAKEKLGYTGDESMFLEQYRRFEVGEHLYVAGVFKDLSRNCHIDAKKALTEAANLYFNKSLRSARSLGLDDLAEALMSSSRSFNCTEMTENEYEYFDETVSASSAGFSHYFQQSMPASKEEVKSIKSVLKAKKREGWLKKTAKALVVTAGIVAGMAVGGVGHESVTAKPADQVKCLPISHTLEFESFPFDKFLNDPEVKKIIGGGYEEYRSSNRMNYLGYLGMNNEGDVKGSTKLSADQYLRLIWGPPKTSPRYFIDTDTKESVIHKASVKYGLEGENVNPFTQLIWNNVKNHNFSSKIDRETFTGLPYEVLDEIAGKAPCTGRTMEELIEISAKYFRQLLDEKKLNVPEAIAVYYCGEDAVSKARWAAYKNEANKRKIPPVGEEIDRLCKENSIFWKYCHHLPAGRGKELAIQATVNSAYEHTSSFAEGCMPLEWERMNRISRRYKDIFRSLSPSKR